MSIRFDGDSDSTMKQICGDGATHIPTLYVASFMTLIIPRKGNLTPTCGCSFVARHICKQGTEDLATSLITGHHNLGGK